MIQGTEGSPEEFLVVELEQQGKWRELYSSPRIT
jgi:hypothetical protein